MHISQVLNNYCYCIFHYIGILVSIVHLLTNSPAIRPFLIFLYIKPIELHVKLPALILRQLPLKITYSHNQTNCGMHEQLSDSMHKRICQMQVWLLIKDFETRK